MHQENAVASFPNKMGEVVDADQFQIEKEAQCNVRRREVSTYVYAVNNSYVRVERCIIIITIIIITSSHNYNYKKENGGSLNKERLELPGMRLHPFLQLIGMQAIANNSSHLRNTCNLRRRNLAVIGDRIKVLHVSNPSLFCN